MRMIYCITNWKCPKKINKFQNLQVKKKKNFPEKINKFMNLINKQRNFPKKINKFKNLQVIKLFLKI